MEENKIAAGQAGLAKVLDLPTAIMNLPCKPGRAVAMNGASKQAYQEGHRDARHAAADIVLARADELVALAAPVANAERASFLQALKTISAFPITDPDKNMDALNMKLIAADALAATPVAATEQATIDTPEFQSLLKAYRNSTVDFAERKAELIAHINGAKLAPLATPADAGAGEELTDEQIDAVWSKLHAGSSRWMVDFGYQQFARAIEREVLARLSTPGAQVTASEDQAVLNKQVAAWRKEVARLQDLIATATGTHSAPADRDAIRDQALAARPSEWTGVTGPGQVKVGDRLRFTIGDKSYSERAKLILHTGTDKEEVIYNRKRNFYFITAMVLSGFSNHKNVEFQPSASPTEPVRCYGATRIEEECPCADCKAERTASPTATDAQEGGKHG